MLYLLVVLKLIVSTYWLYIRVFHFIGTCLRTSEIFLDNKNSLRKQWSCSWKHFRFRAKNIRTILTVLKDRVVLCDFVAGKKVPEKTASNISTVGKEPHLVISMLMWFSDCVIFVSLTGVFSALMRKSLNKIVRVRSDWEHSSPRQTIYLNLSFCYI